MYLTKRPTDRCTSRQWNNGRITQTHLLKLNGGVPRTSLALSFWRDLLYMAAKLLKKGMGMHFTLVFILEEMSGKWHGQWPVPPYGHSLWCILCHYTLMSVHDIPAWKHGWNLHHEENGGCIAKTRDLDYAYAGTKRSAAIYRGNTVTYVRTHENWSPINKLVHTHENFS